MSGGSWKVAYADFMTAMMAFFLLMWILAMVPKEEQSQIAGFFQDPGGYVSPSTKDIALPTGTPSTAGDKYNVAVFNHNLMEKLKNALAASNVLDNYTISVSEAGVNLRVSNDLVFEKDHFDLTPVGRDISFAVSRVLNDNINVSIRGHADQSENGNPTFTSNWELSAVRAGVVANYMVNSLHVASNKISVYAYGDTNPLVVGNGNKGAPENRRVDFLLYRANMKLSPAGMY